MPTLKSPTLRFREANQQLLQDLGIQPGDDASTVLRRWGLEEATVARFGPLAEKVAAVAMNGATPQDLADLLEAALDAKDDPALVHLRERSMEALRTIVTVYAGMLPDPLDPQEAAVGQSLVRLLTFLQERERDPGPGKTSM